MPQVPEVSGWVMSFARKSSCKIDFVQGPSDSPARAASDSPGELVSITATVQDDEQDGTNKPRCMWQKPFCPQDWSKSAVTEVLKYANIVIAEHPGITASDAEDNAARVAETAFLDCIGKQLTPGFWLGHDFDDSERSMSLIEESEESEESDTLGGEAQLSWGDFEDFPGDTMSGVEYLAMGACDEINPCEDMEDVVEYGENQGEATGSFEDDMEDSWEEARRGAFRRDMLGEEEAPFMAMDFQL
ncbi:hypothetical protein V8F06_001381 [Rhypophila decipiens]